MALASTFLSLYIFLFAYIFTGFACADPDSLYQRQDDGLLTSPPDYPSPWADPEANGWEQAYAQARDFVSQLTLLEKVNLTTGVGLVNSTLSRAFVLSTTWMKWLMYLIAG
jgi:hypothetical protein